MTKFSIVVALCLGSLGLHSQSLDDVNKLLNAEKYAEAKAAIDKHMLDPKNAAKSEAWYFKGRTYNAYSFDKSLNDADKYNYKMQAFEAFKKNQELDKLDIRMKSEMYNSYLNIYASLYDVGAGAFNAKDFESAYNAFKAAQDVENFILSKNYTYTGTKLNALDTGLVLNTAISAMQAKKEEEAIANYRKLTDGNVSGKEYQEVYEYLVDYYNKKGDATNLKVVLDKGKKFYPANEYWADVELEAVRAEVKKSGDNAPLFAKYEELIATNPSNYLLNFNYSIDQFNQLYVGDKKTIDEDAAKLKLTNTLKAAIDADKGIDASLLMTKHLYNVSSDLSIAANLAKGTKPEDIKKKADLTAKTKVAMAEFLTYGDKVSAYYDGQATLKPVEKAKYKELLTNMSEVYNYLKDPKKMAEVDKKRAAL
ncbi:MAG: hypothetical protein EOO13_08795 [Chitinophagaceae bacterium]|nr:MAG: hypothetical protein EOO13_08795 [Chitinophagaceae bacterium]